MTRVFASAPRPPATARPSPLAREAPPQTFPVWARLCRAGPRFAAFGLAPFKPAVGRRPRSARPSPRPCPARDARDGRKAGARPTPLGRGGAGGSPPAQRHGAWARLRPRRRPGYAPSRCARDGRTCSALASWRLPPSSCGVAYGLAREGALTPFRGEKRRKLLWLFGKCRTKDYTA